MTQHCSLLPTHAQEPNQVIQLWMLRILVRLGGHRGFISSRGFTNDTVAEGLGLGLGPRPGVVRWFDPGPEDFDYKAALVELREVHQRAERENARASLPPCLLSNVAKLSHLVGLSTTDCRILEFAVAIHTERLLDETADWLEDISSVKTFRILSVILDIPEPDIRAALGLKGILARAGLVSIDRNNTRSLGSKLDLLSDSFADLMVSHDADPMTLLRGTVSGAGEGLLSLKDYHHIQPVMDILLPYLHQSNVTQRRGVNIFIHGAPGTGKTQLARALAGELQCELFEVASEDAEGNPVDGERRLRAFQAAQSFFSNRRALIVFDEVEDVFDDGNNVIGGKSTAQVRKAWINRLLEENAVPSLWLSNSIDGLDPAFIRRFDIVFELPVPSKKQRERILHQSCGDLLDTACISRIAESEGLAPAVITKATSVVRTISAHLGQPGSALAFERLITNTLKAQGHKPGKKENADRLPDTYDPAFINAATDLKNIADGLDAVRSGRLCLYGPPGTGKTAYVRWLAQKLDMPLLVKRASDFLGPYVGENEQNIARAFREADQDGAILLIDEVDSFLQPRERAQQSWEVSLVNEMLTQVESFSGLFVASTNLMDGIDQAALRRFDLKIKFDYLRTEQACELLRRQCQSLGLVIPESPLLARIGRLQNLTPGDFSAVLRQHRFRPLKWSEAFVSALEAECRLKQGPRTSIGFL